ncbi:MAG: RhuM family protein [Longibaculum sp.]
MTQKGISELFECSTDNIGFHLKNIYLDEGLVKEATTEHFLVVQDEGNRQVRRTLEFYNLDVIIIVEYRVNSKKKIFILLIIKKLLKYRYRKTII